MEPIPGGRRRLAAWLAVIAAAWPLAAARAEVVSITVGVNPTCPDGLVA